MKEAEAPTGYVPKVPLVLQAPLQYVDQVIEAGYNAYGTSKQSHRVK